LDEHESLKMSIDFYAEYVKLAGDKKQKTREFVHRCRTKILLKTTNIDELSIFGGDSRESFSFPGKRIGVEFIQNSKLRNKFL
jgi:hypothetical protein